MSSRAFRRLTEDLQTYDSTIANEELSLTQHKPQISAFSNFGLLCTTPKEHVPLPSADDSDEPTPPVKPKKKRKPKKKAQSAKPEFSNLVDTSRHDHRHHTEAPLFESKASGSGLCADLLVVNNKNLDPMMELGKLFGNHVIRGATSSQQPQHHTRYHSKRGALVRIKVTWPPLVRFGLDMDKLPCGSYTFTHNKEYRNTQKSFYVALNSMDPNNLVRILTDFPYHVDSLLQLSGILLHQDNSEMSMDLLERVLHAYQSAFHPRFNPALGTCRLDYRRQENRGLFVALFRYAVLIGSRGCYRNALDYCKILLSLDVDNDPLAALLMIDHYALSSGQFDFLLQLYARLNPSRNLHLLPNFAYSVALAVYLKKESQDVQPNADELLQDALIMFPGFLTRLLKHISLGGINNLDKSVLFGREVRSEPDSLGRLLDLYVARTHPLWASAQVQPWLERNVEVVLGLFEPHPTVTTGHPAATDARLKEYSKRRQTFYPALPMNIVRHLILADIPEAPPILPRDHTSTIYIFDPLPPADSIDIYSPDEERRRLQSTHANRGFFSSFFASLLPDYSPQQPFTEVGVADGDAANENTQSTTGTGHALRLATERLATALRRVLDLHQEDNDQTGHITEQTHQHEPD
ncbi:hypothetical protein P879_02591 [Paragonimus westermani]|uniref:Transcription factor 25 n=1 Tax=Paragonimus westermani TaxID=34504 RepID=A0A8T0DI77_9TREM|nr:hypothetical protein P879_02591 [Paragonimus westermani]